jgi:SAM-dependent methyltransferase
LITRPGQRPLPGRTIDLAFDEQLRAEQGQGYAVTASYYDLIFPDPIRDQLAAALRKLLPGARTIAEIGPGTGLFTEVLLDLLPPDGEIYAIEPARVMRAALTTRLAGDPRAARMVTILPDDALTAEPTGTVDAIVLFNVVMHFSAEQRTRLWQKWASLLNPGGLVILESQYPQAPTAVPETRTPARRLGRHRYETVSRADVIDAERIRWTMTYRTLADDKVRREETTDYDVYVISDEQLDRELAAVGYAPVANRPDGILAWRRNNV